MAYRSSSSLAGASGATCNVPVPTGAASGDIVVVGIYKENTANITTVPSGFTLKAQLDTTAGSRGSLWVYWKRLTAGDTGTYNFAWTGSTWRAAAAAAFSGRVATGDPFDGTVGTAQSTTSVSTLNVSTSPAAASGDAVGSWTNFTGGNAFTPPTNYTERVDIDVIGLFTRDNVASGSTGNVTATSNVSGFQKAFLGVLALATSGDATATPAVVAAASAISVPSVTGTVSSTATPGAVAVTASIPAAVATAAKFIADTAGSGTAQHFVDQAGDPILVRGYVLWGLLMNAGRWGGTWQSDLEDAVTALQAMGCNVLYTEPLGNTQNGGAFNNGNTWDSVAPFTSTSPVTFNTTFWQRSDYLFDLCEAAGITVFFNFAYSDDLDSAALSGFSTTQFSQYGTALGNRYKTRPNLVWMMGGDYFDTFNTQVSAVKTAIRATGDTHLFGVQNYPETSSRKDIENNSTQSTGTNNSEFNFVYSYNAIYWGIEYAWAESSPLPVIWGDGHFDQNTTADRKVMRDLLWWTMSLGGRGMIYGSEGTWAWGSGALSALTSDTFPNTDMGGMLDLFANFTNWHQLVPDTDNSFVTAGRGTKSDYVTSSGGGGGEYNSSDTQAPYVTASVTADGTLAVAYFPVDQTITVDDTELAAGYTATWVDPVSGSTSSATIASTYSPTGNNSIGGPDWLLVFQAAADPNATVTPAAVTATTSVPAVTLQVGQTSSPAAVTGTAVVPASTVHTGAGVTPSAVAAVASVPAPSVSAGGGAAVTAVTVAAVSSVPAVTMQAGSLVTATSVAAVAAVPAPTVQTSGNATVSASAVGASCTVPEPAVLSGSSPAPAAVQGIAQIPVVSVAAAVTVTLGAMSAATTVPAPAVSAGGSAIVATAAVAAGAAIPTPAPNAGVRVIAAAVTAGAAIPTPAIGAGAGATVTPATVAGTIAVPVSTIRLGAFPTPVAVTSVASVAAPTVATSSNLLAVMVAAVATVPTPAVVSIVAGTAHSAVGNAPEATAATLNAPTATAATMPVPTATGG